MLTPFVFAILAATLCEVSTAAGDLRVSILPLPPLLIDGQPARAHTQGLEIVSNVFYVTARREDTQPKRSLLLRTDSQRSDWDVWDITPLTADGALTSLDHPGGFQSDGRSLWIPLAESRRHGRSIIRRFPFSSITPGQPLAAETEFSVEDHIGALAVSTESKTLLGASWDTERVYLWDYSGKRLRTFSRPELSARDLGVSPSSNQPRGLTVQDWKFVQGQLFASGLFRDPAAEPSTPQSRLARFTGFAEPSFQSKVTSLPKQFGTELSREGLAISGGHAWFLPEDLGPSNRVFRASLPEL